MKRSILSIMLLTLCLARSEGETTAGEGAPSRESLVPIPAERDARLGIFVHWGYSGLCGTWQGRKYGGYPEHIQRMAKIPIQFYLTDVPAPSIPRVTMPTSRSASRNRPASPRNTMPALRCMTRSFARTTSFRSVTDIHPSTSCPVPPCSVRVAP
jgi:hypothetical protein